MPQKSSEFSHHKELSIFECVSQHHASESAIFSLSSKCHSIRRKHLNIYKYPDDAKVLHFSSTDLLWVWECEMMTSDLLVQLQRSLYLLWFLGPRFQESFQWFSPFLEASWRWAPHNCDSDFVLDPSNHHTPPRHKRRHLFVSAALWVKPFILYWE